MCISSYHWIVPDAVAGQAHVHQPHSERSTMIFLPSQHSDLNQLISYPLSWLLHRYEQACCDRLCVFNRPKLRCSMNIRYRSLCICRIACVFKGLKTFSHVTRRPYSIAHWIPVLLCRAVWPAIKRRHAAAAVTSAPRPSKGYKPNTESNQRRTMFSTMQRLFVGTETTPNARGGLGRSGNAVRSRRVLVGGTQQLSSGGNDLSHVGASFFNRLAFRMAASRSHGCHCA